MGAALRGSIADVLDAVAFGVDPNVRTPAHGAPPIFYATCGDLFGRADIGFGDAARCDVLQLFASMHAVDLDITGSASWAEGRTVYDLAASGRCPEAALAALRRGEAA